MIVKLKGLGFSLRLLSQRDAGESLEVMVTENGLAWARLHALAGVPVVPVSPTELCELAAASAELAAALGESVPAPVLEWARRRG